MLNWDNIGKSTGNNKIFNKGIAGECVANVTVESAAGKTGPNGNPLPDYITHIATFTDPSTPEARPITIEIKRVSPTNKNGQPTSEVVFIASLKVVKELYEAILPDQPLPVVESTGVDCDDTNAMINAAMSALVGKTAEVRVVVQYERYGQQHNFLNVRQDLYKVGILPKESTAKMEPVDPRFQERLVADSKEVPQTDAAMPIDDLPF